MVVQRATDVIEVRGRNLPIGSATMEGEVMRSPLVAVSSACFALAACSADQGTHPHDMSSARHEAMARSEDQSAKAHEAQYDPRASVQRGRCGAGKEAWAEPCWSSTVNPTGAHLADAERHRELAAKHRAASQALRDAEARACVGLADADRDMSPFAHREDIASVQELVVRSGGGKASSLRTKGAVVVIRAVPGLTPQWLQRVIDCHLARNAALGHDVPEMPYCPLVPNGITASVTPTDTGFAVAIQSEDPTVGQEILRRAQGLGAR
jgi:hypothetical protein